jgi:hypothetical protein
MDRYRLHQHLINSYRFRKSELTEVERMTVFLTIILSHLLDQFRQNLRLQLNKLSTQKCKL